MTYLSRFLFVYLFLLALPALGQEVTLKGKIQSGADQTALEFANVALLSMQDSALVAGGMSELNGAFEFTAPQGKYILRVGFIGFTQYFERVDLSARNQVNLGIITLQQDAQNLDEVVVEGVTSMFESDIDKRVYNVENSIVAEGATASELLSTLPSIQVDDEGGITMRGSGNILIYINGRRPTFPEMIRRAFCLNFRPIASNR